MPNLGPREIRFKRNWNFKQSSWKLFFLFDEMHPSIDRFISYYSYVCLSSWPTKDSWNPTGKPTGWLLLTLLLLLLFIMPQQIKIVIWLCLLFNRIIGEIFRNSYFERFFETTKSFYFFVFRSNVEKVFSLHWFCRLQVILIVVADVEVYFDPNWKENGFFGFEFRPHWSSTDNSRKDFPSYSKTFVLNKCRCQQQFWMWSEFFVNFAFVLLLI